MKYGSMSKFSGWQRLRGGKPGRATYGILTITQQRRGSKIVGLSTSTQRKAPMKRSMILAAIFSLATAVSAATPASACWLFDAGHRGHCGGWGLFCGCGLGK